ncbi:MAG TPA: ATP-binding protein [Oligoflexia bacterium]|nr:ATP-binding protein [Oligoflexia bacterium]HMP48212.1 ATP-binding protein [Oligoflexia bacterium]
MDITILIEKLADDPFNLELRSQLAFQYANLGEYKKVLKQLKFISDERELEDSELNIKITALRKLGFDEEADTLKGNAESSDFENNSNPESLNKIRVIQGGTKKQAEVLPLKSPNKNVVRFSDIGGHEDTKKVLRLQIIEPFLRPDLYNRFKKQAGGGVLLYGAPGCGKTMLAKAIAFECGAEFIPVRISEVLSRWIGESEFNLSGFFDKARAKKPSMLFFDELDALAYSRSKSSSDYSRTLVNEFLNQLDGVGFDNEDILFLAATNMPWDVDSAMKRPGRFSRLIFIPPPCEVARLEILKSQLIGIPVDNFDLVKLSKKLNNFSGADIVGLVDLAKEHALNEMLESGTERNLREDDFNKVLIKMLPSTEDWLRTARNLVKYSGGDRSYQDVEEYLRDHRML